MNEDFIIGNSKTVVRIEFMNENFTSYPMKYTRKDISILYLGYKILSADSLLIMLPILP